MSLAVIAPIGIIRRKERATLRYAFRHHANPWAACFYDDPIARGKDHPHATRILARAWLGVIWRCWQDGSTYNPNQHGTPSAPQTGPEAA